MNTNGSDLPSLVSTARHALCGDALLLTQPLGNWPVGTVVAVLGSDPDDGITLGRADDLNDALLIPLSADALLDSLHVVDDADAPVGLRSRVEQHRADTLAESYSLVPDDADPWAG